MEKFTVKQWRQIKGETQLDLAKFLGMPVSTYQNKEAGKSGFGALELYRIAKHFGISIESQVELK